jgi:hypothetical protein
MFCRFWLVLVAASFLGCGQSSRSVPEELAQTNAAQSKAQSGALTVRHTPNPCDVHRSAKDPNPPAPYMWYYRTDVKNNLDVPLRVIWFEGYTQVNGRWVANNILGRTLTAADFSQWYTEGDPVVDGVIKPGQTATCDPNWHASTSPKGMRVKWAYKAAAPDGQEHYAEGIVESVSIRTK